MVYQDDGNANNERTTTPLNCLTKTKINITFLVILKIQAHSVIHV